MFSSGLQCVGDAVAVLGLAPRRLGPRGGLARRRLGSGCRLPRRRGGAACSTRSDHECKRSLGARIYAASPRTPSLLDGRRGDAREMQLNLLLGSVVVRKTARPLRLFCCIAAICSCPSTAARRVSPPLACGDGSVLQTKNCWESNKTTHPLWLHAQACEKRTVD